MVEGYEGAPRARRAARSKVRSAKPLTKAQKKLAARSKSCSRQNRAAKKSGHRFSYQNCMSGKPKKKK